MNTMDVSRLKEGDKVRIIQQIDRREGAWTADVVGTLIEVLDAPTGSWYAHGKKDRYWLTRVRLRKDNGEVTLVSLDEDSRVILLDNKSDATTK